MPDIEISIPYDIFAGAQGYTIHPLTGRKILSAGNPTIEDMKRLDAITTRFPDLKHPYVKFYIAFYNLDREGREAYLEAFESWNGKL